jgi:hypothetical protein
MADIPERANFPAEEARVLEYWKSIDAFRTSLKLSEGRPEYTFYDGPPFATGLPHYGHILAGTIKDIVTRYAAQTGFYVSRRFGWDCHGLPVEYEIDKKLGITSREQVGGAVLVCVCACVCYCVCACVCAVRTRPHWAAAPCAFACARPPSRCCYGAGDRDGHCRVQRGVPRHRDAVLRGVGGHREPPRALDRLQERLQDDGAVVHGERVERVSEHLQEGANCVCVWVCVCVRACVCAYGGGAVRVDGCGGVDTDTGAGAQGLVYKGFKVMPYSTACNTPLSNFEANQNYQEVTDPVRAMRSSWCWSSKLPCPCDLRMCLCGSVWGY